jgi:plasmid replication initiation protein
VFFGDFDRKVLQVALKEINDQTDISFTYVTKKTGEKITDLEFKVGSHLKVLSSTGKGNN